MSYYSAVSAQFFILGALYATEDYQQFFLSIFFETEIFGESSVSCDDISASKQAIESGFSEKRRSSEIILS